MLFTEFTTVLAADLRLGLLLDGLFRFILLSRRVQQIQRTVVKADTAMNPNGIGFMS
jgi:hypothetical protein